MESTHTLVTLSNGLRIILKEIHTAPLISQWIWYRVGSRNERPGNTGISHWVEHMQFKGTPQFSAGVLDRAIAREGGYWNASTHLDWSVYYETLPAEKIDLALTLEADRMKNSLFDLQDVESERSVIISERQGNENEPLFLLNEQVQSAAFRVHSYHHQVIGNLFDLQAITRSELYEYYCHYYIPNNAVLILAGDFETDVMLERLRVLYEPVPTGQPPKFCIEPEPIQTDEHRIVVEGPGETSYVVVAYRAPAASHPDFFALVVLDSLLAGAQSPTIFAGGLSNKTSRLYQALVDTGLAVGVSGGFQATIDPFLNTFICVVHPPGITFPQTNSEQVLAAFDSEIACVQKTPPSTEDVARAVKQARALFAYGSDGIVNQASWLGLAEMFAPPGLPSRHDWFDHYLERLAQVTPEDVQRVAQFYMPSQQRVVGFYHPTGDPLGAAAKAE